MKQNIIIGIISIITALGTGEFFLRLTDKAPKIGVMEKDGYILSDNKKIGFEPVPNFKDNNNHGFRDKERNINKKSMTKRILVIGDSITFGRGISNKEDIFTAKLEKLLVSKNYNVEIINFGVSGYNTQQEIELYKKNGLKFKPDIILLAYCLNDKGMVAGANALEIFSSLLNSKNDVLYSQEANQYLIVSHLYRLAYFIWKTKFKKSNPLESLKDYESLTKDNRAIYFKELSDLTKPTGQQVVVIIFPLFGSLPLLSSEKSDILNYKFNEEHEFVKKLSTENGFKILDLLSSYRDCFKINPNLAQDVYHPTEFGHECAANSISFFLESIGLLN